MHRPRKFVYIVGFSLLALLPQAVEAGPPQNLKPDELETLLEKAERTEDHLKLAAHYAADAQRLAKDAERHQALATRYRRRNLPPKTARIHQDMVKHCNSLAQSLRNAAKGARQLAESHKKMVAYKDIRTVGTMDPFPFRLTSHAETYNFDLKQRLSPEDYRMVWHRVYTADFQTSGSGEIAPAPQALTF